MSIPIKRVPMWTTYRGIGHATALTDGAINYSVCGSLFIGGRNAKKRPKRVCRKCRLALKRETMKLVTTASASP